MASTDDYINWKGNVSLLYDTMLPHAMTWGSLTFEWQLPKPFSDGAMSLLRARRDPEKLSALEPLASRKVVAEADLALKGGLQHTVLLAPRTPSEFNGSTSRWKGRPCYLTVSTLTLQRPRTSNPRSLGRIDETQASSKVSTSKLIVHPGEVNRARVLPGPSHAHLAVTHTDEPTVLVWNTATQPPRLPWNRVRGDSRGKHQLPSIPDLALVGHKAPAEYALDTTAAGAHGPAVASGGADNLVCLWRLEQADHTCERRPRARYAAPARRQPDQASSAAAAAQRGLPPARRARLESEAHWSHHFKPQAEGFGEVAAPTALSWMDRSHGPFHLCYQNSYSPGGSNTGSSGMSALTAMKRAGNKRRRALASATPPPGEEGDEEGEGDDEAARPELGPDLGLPAGIPTDLPDDGLEPALPWGEEVVAWQWSQLEQGRSAGDRVHGAPSLAACATFVGHEATVEDVSFMPGTGVAAGNVLCSVGDDRQALLWDARAGTAPVSRLRGLHTDDINAVDWSKVNPCLIATGGGDECVKVVDIRRLTQSSGAGAPERSVVCSLSGHSGAILSVQWCPHIGVAGASSVLSSAAEDGTVVLWDCARLQGPPAALWSMPPEEAAAAAAAAVELREAAEEAAAVPRQPAAAPAAGTVATTQEKEEDEEEEEEEPANGAGTPSWSPAAWFVHGGHRAPDMVDCRWCPTEFEALPQATATDWAALPAGLATIASLSDDTGNPEIGGGATLHVWRPTEQLLPPAWERLYGGRPEEAEREL